MAAMHRAMTTAQGLTAADAAARLAKYGPNAVPEAKAQPWRRLLARFWSPVPWLLEATVVLQLALGKSAEALVIAALLVINAFIGSIQEQRADRALALLRQRLSIMARVRRDGRWQSVPAAALVPGDVVHLRVGDLVPADMYLVDGALLLDQAALTGESLPVEAGPATLAYAGSMVRRGEATGQISATGTGTYFGRTAELVRTARTESHLARLIVRLVRPLVALDLLLVLALFVYALRGGLPLHELLPFALMLLVTAVPAALPATFTLAQAFGARELAARGVLVTRLAAIEEAAAMAVLACDKTGTLTENRLQLAALAPRPPHDQDALLRLAALACDEATQDPIDLAILAAVDARGLRQELPRRREWLPFDPETKRAEAVYELPQGPLRVVKGAPRAVAALIPGADLGDAVQRLAAGGYRVLAVAVGAPQSLALAGLLAFEDPPRADSRAVLERLKALGVRVVMVTGDGLATARAVATRLGIGERACPPQALRDASGDPLRDCDVFARVLPEDKFHLVQRLQHGGRVAGMTGDGVNDAPALRQAEVGIAVANATDVAKAAASMVLTNPGLADVVCAIETSRRVYRRLLTYTLNKVVKTLEIALFLSLGVMLSGSLVVTPLLMVLLLFTNDFVTMAIATDHAPVAARPLHWRVGALFATGAALAVLVLALSFAVYFAARAWLHLPLAQLQTLAFLLLVFTGQGMVYLLRESGHFWRSRPSRWLLAASVTDLALVTLLAVRGILMTAVDPRLVLALLALVTVYLALVDFAKVRLLRWSGLA